VQIKKQFNVGDLIVYGKQYVIYITDLIYTLDEETNRIEYRYIKIPPHRYNDLDLSTPRETPMMSVICDISLRKAKHYRIKD
jgi:hypothetical protein